ncbi:hypothetical protein D3C72_1935140 [compost metagenome]
MINGLFAQGVAHRDQLADGDQLALRTPDRQAQQCLQVAVAFCGQLQKHGRRVFAGVAQPGGGFAAQPRMQRAHDGLLGNAQQGRLAPVHDEQLARGVGNAAVVGVHNAFGSGQRGAHSSRHFAPAIGLGAIHLGHDGR